STAQLLPRDLLHQNQLPKPAHRPPVGLRPGCAARGTRSPNGVPVPTLRRSVVRYSRGGGPWMVRGPACSYFSASLISISRFKTSVRRSDRLTPFCSALPA